MILYTSSPHGVPIIPSYQSWSDLISVSRQQPFLKLHPAALVRKIVDSCTPFLHLPLYTLCDGAGGTPVGLITPSKLLAIIESTNHTDISNYLYISHPFRQHYCDLGRQLLSSLYDLSYSHSSDPDDYMLFHYLMGGRFSFTHAHNHDTATAILLDGLKEWWICPPHSSNSHLIQPAFMSRVRYLYTNPTSSFYDWLDANTELVTPIESLSVLAQPPGSSLYLPDKWYHAVINHQLSSSITLAWPYPVSNNLDSSFTQSDSVSSDQLQTPSKPALQSI